LRKEYENLFNTCVVSPKREADVEAIVSALLPHKARYQDVSGRTGVPWFFIAVVHNMESSRSFKGHLHNGDPLTARTKQVPAGRPKTGNPPFTWEESATDALAMKGLSAQTDWSLAGTLYQLERFNGWGYRLYHPHVLSPYLWSFSGHYRNGKYIADGTWSEIAVSKQCGAAVLLRRMAERGEIEFTDQPAPAPDALPIVVRHSTSKPQDAAEVRRAEELQRWLNSFPGIFIKVDGIPGDRTSAAYQKVTGRYLPGDPRAKSA
jgi:lysozyme family protein